MAVVANMNNMGMSLVSPSSTFDLPKSHYIFPSPPPEIHELAHSADARCCWPSHSDPCVILDNFYSTRHLREEDTSSTSRPRTSGPEQDPQSEAGTSYLSPPPTGSQQKISIPLPEEAACKASIVRFLEAGGILDSPRVMRDVTRSHTPISPPPTIPTTTQALPEPKTRHTDDCDWDTSPPQSENVDHPVSHSTSPGRDDEAAVDHANNQYSAKGGLLSPLSPEWSTRISNLTIGERQTEPPSLTFQKGYRESLYDDNDAQHPSGDDLDLDLHVIDNFLSPESHDRTAESLSMDTGMSMSSGDPGSGDDIRDMLMFSEPSGISNLDMEESSWHSGQQPDHWSSPEHESHNFTSPPLHLMPSLDEPQCHGICVSSFPGCDSQQSNRPSIEPLTIPYTSNTPTFPDHNLPLSYLHSDWHSRGYENYLQPPSDLLQPIDSDLCDIPGLVTPDNDKSLPLPSSPFTSFPPSPYDFQDDMDFPLSSPSPSRRSFSSLPELDESDDLPYHSPSGPTLLSLPGADTDADLLPAFSEDEFPSQESCPLTPMTGLLLIDDPDDVPAPRSPSPDDFDIDLDIDDTVYPEFEQLCELRKRALSNERAARQLETQLLEQGDICSRAETRRHRKGEKEKSKEIGALLRLKLGNDKVAVLQGEEKKPKKLASSMPRLVAKMVFRRHDTNRPIRNRKLSGSTPYDYVQSPLSQSVSPYFIGEEDVAES